MLVISCFAFGQKVKFKNNTILVDDKEWATYKGCGMFDVECTIVKGDNEVSYIVNRVTDRSLISRYNKDGEIVWKEVKFIGLNQSYETQDSDKDIVKNLIENKIFKEDNSFDENQVLKLVEKKGQNFSRRYYNR